MPVQLAAYLSGARRSASRAGGSMSAMRSWFLAVVAVLALVLALHHLGVDVMAEVASVMANTKQVLARPLVSL